MAILAKDRAISLFQQQAKSFQAIINCTNEKRLPKEALSTDWRVEVF